MRRMPINTKQATQELWAELDQRLETTRRAYGNPPREALRRELELYTETLNLWQRGEILTPQVGLSVDALVVGFSDDVRQAIIHHLRGLGLRAEGAPDNRYAYAMMHITHTRAILYDVGARNAGAFQRVASLRQPHVKWIAVGDPNDAEVFRRMQRVGSSAFIPYASVDTWSERIRPFNQCVLATLARQERVCPHFGKGRPCLGECERFESPASPLNREG